jgi:hypothetical protein
MLRLLGIGQNLINGFRPKEGIAHSESPATDAKLWHEEITGKTPV